MAILGRITQVIMIPGIGTGVLAGGLLGHGDHLGAGLGALPGHGDPHGIGAGDLHGAGDRLGVHPGVGEVVRIMQIIDPVVAYLTVPDPTGLQILVPEAISVIAPLHAPEAHECHNMETTIPIMVSTEEAQRTIIAPIVEMLLPIQGIV